MPMSRANGSLVSSSLAAGPTGMAIVTRSLQVARTHHGLSVRFAAAWGSGPEGATVESGRLAGRSYYDGQCARRLACQEGAGAPRPSPDGWSLNDTPHEVGNRRHRRRPDLAGGQPVARAGADRGRDRDPDRRLPDAGCVP